MPARKQPPQNVEEAADEVEKPDTRRMTVVERINLTRRIASARLKQKPDTWQVISKREGGIPPRTLRYIYAQYEAEQQMIADPIAIVDETLALYTEAIKDLAQAAADAQGDGNMNAKVGALRTMLDAAKGRLELLAAVGRLPRRLRVYDEQARVERMIVEMAAVVEQYDVAPELVLDLLGVIEKARGQHEVIDAKALPAGEAA